MAITNWAEYVRDLTARRVAYLQEPAPAPSDMENYFQYKKLGAKLDREWSALVDVVIRSGHFNRDMVEAALFTGVEARVLNDRLPKIESTFADYIPLKIKNRAIDENKLAIINNYNQLPEEEKTAYKQRLINGEIFDEDLYNTLTAEEKERAKKTWLSPREEFDAYFSALNLRLKPEPALIGAVIEKLGNELEPELANSLATELSSVPDLMDAPLEEQVTYPYREMAGQLKMRAGEELSDDPEKLQRVNEALDYAANKLTRVKPAAKNALMNEETWIGEATSASDNAELEAQKAEGKKVDICQSEGFSDGSIQITDLDETVSEELLSDSEELLSPQYKETLIQMLSKMDEMQMLGPDEAGESEEPYKMYAFKKLILARSELQNAVQEGNFDRILEAKEKYESISRDYDALFAMADGLNNSRFGMQDNIACTRTESMPWEYNRDLRKHVQLNGVYQIYRQMHALKLKPEEYLSNVAKNGIRFYRELAYETGLGAQVKGKDFGGVLDVLLNPESSSKVQGLSTAEKNYRGYNAIQIMEPDPNRKGTMVVFMNRMVNVSWAIISSEVARTGLFHQIYAPGSENAELVKRNRQTALENLITVADEHRDLRRILPPPTVGEDGKLEKPFSADDYVRDNAADYDGMVSRIRILLEKSNTVAAGNYVYTVTNKNGATSDENLEPEVLLPEQVIEAAFNAGQRVLNAKVQEAGNEAYENLRREIANLAMLLPPEAALAGNADRLAEVQRIKTRIAQAFPVKALSDLAKPIVNARKAALKEKAPEASDRQAYFEYVKRKGEADLGFFAIKRAVSMARGLSEQTLEEVMAAVVPAEKLTEIRQKVIRQRENTLPSRLYAAAAERGRAYSDLPAYSNMSAEQKESFRQRMAAGEIFDVNAWKDLSAEEKARTENVFLDADARFRGALNTYEWALGDDMDTLVRVYSALQERLSPYESWLLSKRLEEIPVNRERTLQDEVEYPLEKDVADLIKFAETELQGEGLNAAKLAELKEVLSDAALKVNVGKADVINEQVTRELGIAHANNAEEKAYMQNLKQLGGEKQWIYFGEGEYLAGASPVLKKETNAATFPEKKPHMSEAYRLTLVSMLQKMKEMELIPEGAGAAAEEGTKKYAFRKLIEAKHSFENAVKQKRIDEVIELKKAYDKEWQNMQELMDMARNGLGQDVFSMPGNVDITRNKDVPWTFARDLKTQAQVNGVYQMFIVMQELGIDDPEVFIDNVAQNGLKYANQRLLKAGVNEKAGNKNLSGIIAMLTDPDNSKELDLAAGDVTRTRWLEALSVMEPDKINPMGLIIYKENYDRMVLDMAEREKVKFNLFKAEPVKGTPNYSLEMSLRKEALERLITVSDEDRTDLSALIGLPGIDENGREKASFDIEEYAARPGRDYQGMIDRVNTLIAQCAGKSGAPTEAEIMEAARSAFRRVLEANVNDRENPGYQALERELGLLPARVYGSGEKLQEASVLRMSMTSDMIAHSRGLLIWMSPYQEEGLFTDMISASERQDISGALQNLLTPEGRKGLSPKQEADKLMKLMGALGEEIAEQGIDVDEDSKVRVNGLPYFTKDAAAPIIEKYNLLKTAVARGKELVKQGGSEITLSMLQIYESLLNMGTEGVSMEQIGATEPLAQLSLANLNRPKPDIDRTKTPLNPGQTSQFTMEEMEEKKDIFPVHRIFQKSYDLGSVWIEYIKKNEAGIYTAQDEEAFKNDLKNRYQELIGIYNSIKQRAEGEQGFNEQFINENMRSVFGQKNAVDSYEDTFGSSRGFAVTFKELSDKVEAIDKGWPVGELGNYAHLVHAAFDIDRDIPKLEGEELSGVRQKALELREYLHEKFIGKAFEADSARRAEALFEAERLYKEVARECEAAEKVFKGKKSADRDEMDRVNDIIVILHDKLGMDKMTQKVENLKLSFNEVVANMGEKARVEGLKTLLAGLDRADKTYPQGAKEYMDVKAALREAANLREEPLGLDKSFADRVRSSVRRLQARFTVLGEGLKKEWYANRKLGEKRAANVADLTSILAAGELSPGEKLSKIAEINKRFRDKSDVLRVASPEYTNLKRALKSAAEFYNQNRDYLRSFPVPPAPGLNASPEQARAMAANVEKVRSRQPKVLEELNTLLAAYTQSGAGMEAQRVAELEQQRFNNVKGLVQAVLPGREAELDRVWNERGQEGPYNEAELTEALRTEYSPQEIIARNKALHDNMEALGNMAGRELRALSAAGAAEGRLNSARFTAFANALRNVTAPVELKSLPAELKKLTDAARAYAAAPESGELGERRRELAGRAAELAERTARELNAAIRTGRYDETELGNIYSIYSDAFSPSVEAIMTNIRAVQNEIPLPDRENVNAVNGPAALTEDVAARLIARFDSLQTYDEKVTFYIDCASLNLRGNLLPDSSGEVFEALERHIFLDEAGELRPNAVNEFMEAAARLNARWRVEAERVRQETGLEDHNLSVNSVRADTIAQNLFHLINSKAPYGFENQPVRIRNAQGQWEDVKKTLSEETTVNVRRRNAQGQWENVEKILPAGTTVNVNWGDHFKQYMQEVIERETANAGIDIENIDMLTFNNISGARKYELSIRTKLELMNNLPEGTVIDERFAAALRTEAGALRGMAEDLGGPDNNTGLMNIISSLDSLSEMTHKSYLNSETSGVVCSGVKDLSMQIYNYLENRSLNKKWLTEKGVVRDELTRVLKGLSPEMSEVWEKRKDIVSRNAETLQGKKDALITFFKDQSAKGTDTLKKIVAAAENGDKEGRIDRISQVINKRYGLGEELSRQMAGEAVWHIEEVARLGKNVSDIYKSSYMFMRDLTLNMNDRKLVDFNITGKNKKINAEYSPKARGNNVEDMARNIAEDERLRDAGVEYGKLKSLLMDPERIDSLREMLNTGKRAGLFNWNSGEYTNLKEALETFCENRDELLKAIMDAKGGLKDDDMKQDLADKVGLASEALKEAIRCTGIYANKVLGGESVMDKSQDAGLVRAAAVFGLQEAFREMSPEAYREAAPQMGGQRLSEAEKIRVKNFTKLYQEEFAKENMDLKSNRHANAAERARQREAQNHRAAMAPDPLQNGRH